MKILHLIKLSGIGGVQSQFEVFFNNLSKKQRAFNLIISVSSIDHAYASLKSSIKNLISLFLIFIFSKNVLIHSYNNLVSKKFYYFFKFLRPKNLIFHERGNAWNINSSNQKFILKNAKLSKMIICNSEATKTILNQKFHIKDEKLKVIYNGVISDEMIIEAKKLVNNQSNNIFMIGYVGRLETNKGVHTIIESMQFLDKKKFQLSIVGDGSLRQNLEDYAIELGLTSVKFMGRVENAWSRIKGFDVLVVPSIREPLGNVVIEAGLCKVPVIASRVDGIPEIIEDSKSGILLKPSNPVQHRFISQSVPLPECVVDIETKRLVKPMEIDCKELAEAIKFLQANPDKANMYVQSLYSKVIDKFHVKKYINELMQAYQEALQN